MPGNRPQKNTRKPHASGERGFTLAEILVLAFIFMIFLSSFSIPTITSTQTKRTIETQKALAEIKEALIAYAIINKKLPKPAIPSTNGTQRSSCSSSDVNCTGFIPWVDLGVSKVDGWKKVIQYSVQADYTSSITCSSAGIKTIQTRNASGSLVPQATEIPVVIWSFGARNYGTSDTGQAVPDNSATNIDEDFNNLAITNPSIFINRSPTDDATVAGGEFSGVVVWIPTDTIKQKLITTGQLTCS